MKRTVLILFILISLTTNTFCQREVIQLVFTAVLDTSFCNMDSIKIINKTNKTDTTLYYPDTVLALQYYPLNTENSSNTIDCFHVLKVFPNPVFDHATILVFLPEKQDVAFRVTNLIGQIVYRNSLTLVSGINKLKFSPGNETFYCLTVIFNGLATSIKIFHNGSSESKDCWLDLMHSDYSSLPMKGNESSSNFAFNPGDQLLYACYKGGYQSGKYDIPDTSSIYTFQFANNIPCPGSSTVLYGGQLYHTVQIFNQCWLKENINIGNMIPSSQAMTNNDLIEKYCYGDDLSNCNIFGGLYTWDEMMEYESLSGSQGICPQNWHVATDEDWKILEGSVDSRTGIGNDEWDYIMGRGYDVGKNLKSTSLWNNCSSGNGSGMYDYTALPGGAHFNGTGFGGKESYGQWWTSTNDPTINDYACFRLIKCSAWWSWRSFTMKNKGSSVRCIRSY